MSPIFHYCPCAKQANRSQRISPAKMSDVINRSSPKGSQSPPLPFRPVRTPGLVAEGQPKDYQIQKLSLPGQSLWCVILSLRFLSGRLLPGQCQEEQLQDKATSWHDGTSWSYGLGWGSQDCQTLPLEGGDFALSLRVPGGHLVLCHQAVLAS